MPELEALSAKDGIFNEWALQKLLLGNGRSPGWFRFSEELRYGICLEGIILGAGEEDEEDEDEQRDVGFNEAIDEAIDEAIAMD